MYRLERTADLDPGYTDASTSLHADSQVTHKYKVNKHNRPAVVNQQPFFDPENDLEIVDEGQKMGHMLAEGYVEDFSEEFAATINEINSVQDQNLQEQYRDDLVDGLESSNPTDIHVTRDANGEPTELFLNVYSELYVNESFGLLDKYSTNPQLDPAIYDNPASTPEEAAANATLHVNSQLAAMKDSLAADTSLDDTTRAALLAIYGSDFVADFNRRRLENNYLPDFIAHTDENGDVEIVYLNPDEGDSKR